MTTRRRRPPVAGGGQDGPGAEAPCAGVDLRRVSRRFAAAPGRGRGAGARDGVVRAVEEVDLVIPAGSVVALLGPSGCGKTTALRLIAGFERPDGGEVRVGGRLVAGHRTWVPPERRRVGMVFQQLALFPHLDVAANVGYGVGRGDRDGRTGAMLDLVGLAGYEHRFPDQLSGGQAQRVALARALAPEPDVVLLDEPFSSLDVSLREGVRRDVRRILRASGTAALIVTHDQDEAMAMGDLVAVMLEGRIVQVAPPEEVYRRPATPAVAEFLGDANLVEGTVRAGMLETEIGLLPLVAGADADGPALGLVRPEDLDLDEVADGPARVLDVEYYGHDQLITLSLPSGRVLRARLHARHRLPQGSRVAVRVAGLGVVAFPLAAPLPAPEAAAH